MFKILLNVFSFSLLSIWFFYFPNLLFLKSRKAEYGNCSIHGEVSSQNKEDVRMCESQ